MALQERQHKEFPFTKRNYIFLAIGAATVFIGFLLMIGGDDNDPSKFNAEELFSFRRITLAPLTVLLGYTIVLIGILKKPKSGVGDEGSNENGNETPS